MTASELLRKFAFFAPFSTEQLDRIANHAEILSLPAQKIVFEAGEYSDRMYLILNGQVRIHRTDEHGEVMDLGILETHQVFGELALLSSEPRLATAVTLTPCEFMVINRALLLDILSDATPQMILEVFAVLSNQIRATNDADFRQRLAKRTLEAQMEVEKQRSLTQMVAGVAHEINTPLGIINTGISIIEREMAKILPLATERKTKSTVDDIGEALRLMSGNIQRAHKLVEDFKKVSVSQLSDSKETLNIVEVVSETLEVAKAHFRLSGITLAFSHDVPVGEQQWFGYRGYLSQILLNLLTNVERYAYERKSGGKVDIALAAGEDHFLLVLQDYGKGIPAENLARIFEPFFTTGRSKGGTGLGMTIVHNLVTAALRGSIHVDSTVGEGTTIRIHFPRVIS